MDARSVKRAFITLFAALLLPLTASASDWESLGVIDGVKVWKRTVPDSDLFAFKGEVVADVHIGKLLTVFRSSERRKDWVAKYADHETIKKGPAFEEYWIRFSLPFPVTDRDYVLRSDAHEEPDRRTYHCRVESIVRDAMKEKDCCVRARVEGTKYRFEALPGGKTRLMVEVQTDPRGMLPDWLVNMIQKKWPSDTLNGLIREAKKARIDSSYADWHEEVEVEYGG